ncbi:lactonase family protein [Sphingobacterium sp. lm-10]|uniref:lactonase family protein n=1 Tax=Sphingobacterium sp. lm-10 TaxID=2944904 RepID=UPI0020201756|nr:lactonase family protein [Sphingobacterium sp. lm-10]MCL7987905.1 lactonase family protein [Sphingobacterium sp. lm-10]
MKTVAFFGMLVLSLILNPPAGTAQSYDMFVGTYTSGTGSKGIYRFNFDAATGDVRPVSTMESPNPSFLARFENRLLAVNEGDGEQATLSLFDISTAKEKLLDKSTTLGDHPCHVAFDPAGNIALVSNYSGGSLALFSLVDNRSKLILHDLLEYEGGGPDTDRQKQAHIHSAFFNDELAYVSDLGSDKIHVYSLSHDGTDLRNGALTLNEQSIIHTIKGGGARHLTFSADGHTLYTIQELTGQIAVFRREEGEWMLKQVESLYGDGFEGKQGGADVKISPDGGSLYATNRGDANLILHYTVLPNGLLEWRNKYSVQGAGPRNFAITPDGAYVLVANQQTNRIVVFKRDAFTGDLEDTGKRIEVPAPVCIIF